MEIDFLLMLQNFREATNNVLSPFLIWLCDFNIGFWPVAAMCVYYWVMDRKNGRKVLFGYSLSLYINGLLKLIFRIPRPWILDERVLPYGDSKLTTTGYSFPSGHATYATSQMGGLGWQLRKKCKIVTVILMTLVIIVMFARTYLGVHMPKDVLVGALSSVVMMIAASKIEDWTDRDSRGDWIVMAVGIVLCIASGIYYNSIVIEPLYDTAGTLIVDPAKMKADSFVGIGNVAALVVCRFFERRYLHFDRKLNRKGRLAVGIIALAPLYWWVENGFNLCKTVSRAFGRFAYHGVIITYAMLIVPAIMTLIKWPAWMREEKEN